MASLRDFSVSALLLTAFLYLCITPTNGIRPSSSHPEPLVVTQQLTPGSRLIQTAVVREAGRKHGEDKHYNTSSTVTYARTHMYTCVYTHTHTPESSLNVPASSTLANKLQYIERGVGEVPNILQHRNNRL